MGKYYYGTHSDKNEAMKIADSAAIKDRSAHCYTPSTIPEACFFHEPSALWICRATAHYDTGSCDIHTVSIYREVNQPESSEVPVQIPIDHISIDVYRAMAEPPAEATSQATGETYSDADNSDYKQQKTL